MTTREFAAAAASPSVSRERISPATGRKDLLWALVVLCSALPLALVIRFIHEAFAGRPETAVGVIGGMLALLAALPVGAYVLARRQRSDPSTLALIVLATIAVMLVAIYLHQAGHQVFFPADILIWSEGDFVNDIIKLRAGYPLYTAQANNESFHYTPGTQLLTYVLAWCSGQETSIAALRMIQLVYTLLAVIVALGCTRTLVELACPPQLQRPLRLWTAVWLPILLLCATNFLSNSFVVNLHNDALAQLISVVAFWLLLRYAASRDARLLVAMAVLPAVGFGVKQSLAIWAPLFLGYLVVFDRPRSLRRLVPFALAALGGIAVVTGAGYVLWGEPFLYWITVASAHGLSPLRSVQHLLQLWAYLAIGLFGGLILLRGGRARLLLGPWCIWLALLLTEIYTSGIAWMMNHAGPGSLIAGVWFSAALLRVWPRPRRAAAPQRLDAWMRAAFTVAVVALVFSGLGVIRIPLPPLPEDAYRYVAEIERQFAGRPAERILMDVGTWVYVRDGVVMKDRAPSIGDRGYAENGDFSGMIQRLKARQYDKILVRNFHSPDFWYDHSLWRTPSGIRQALIEHYRETGRIQAVESPQGNKSRYGFAEISILEPNPA